MTHNLVILFLSTVVVAPTGDPNAGTAIDPSQFSVRARGNIASAFAERDYPYLARQRGERGRVDFKFGTDLNGRIAFCEITKSSGSEILDAVTCPILKARGKLSPALDLQGRPTPDELTGAINWTF